MAKLIECPNCGARVAEAQRHCNACGTEMPESGAGGRGGVSEPPARDDAAGQGAARMRQFASRSRDASLSDRPAEAPFVVRDGVPIPCGYEAHGPVLQRAKGCIVLVRETESEQQCLAKFSLRELDHVALERVRRAGIPSVVHIHAHGLIPAPVSQNYRSYVIEEFCAAGSLRQWLDTRPYDPVSRMDAARRVLSSMANALASLHAQDILHRDIKPENIVVRVGAPLYVALTDFDLAKAADGTEVASTVVATMPYAAPEALLEAGVKPASDYWSLGMLTMEMVTGSHPLAGLGHRAAMLFHFQRTPLPFEQVGDERMRTLLRGLLTRDVAKRWGAREVRAYLSGQPLPEPPPEFEPQSVQRQPLKVGPVYADGPSILGLALLKHWQDGERLLDGRDLEDWLGTHAMELVLAADVAQILRDRQKTAPARLLAVALRCSPEAPLAVFGYDLSGEGLLGLAIAAFSAEAQAPGPDQKSPAQAIDALFEGRLLSLFGAARGMRALTELDHRWVAADAEFDRLIGSDARLRAQRPPSAWVRGCLLACMLSPRLLERMRQEVAQRDLVRECDWFRALGDPASVPPAVLLYMQLAAPQAQDDVRAVHAERAAMRAARRAEWLARKQYLLLVPITLLIPYVLIAMYFMGGMQPLQEVIDSDTWVVFKVLQFGFLLILGVFLYTLGLIVHPLLIYMSWGTEVSQTLLITFGPTYPSLFLAYLYSRRRG